MGARTPQTIAFTVRGPIDRDDLPGLYERVWALLEQSAGPAVVVCDVRGVEPDAVTVDAVSRLRLAARRHGCSVRLRHASDDLVDLIGFMGLADVLPH